MDSEQRDRLTVVEGDVRALASRVAALERELQTVRRPAPPPVVRVSAAPPVPRPATPRPPVEARVRSLEELLGGRVLAWAGGSAVLVGLTFLFAMAASRGWIGPTARVALGALVSIVLVVVGVALRERRAPVLAALAAAGTGIGGLDMTLLAAAQLYHLVPSASALVGAAGVGALATTLAVRFRSGTLAALGILGALLAPPALGSGGGAVVLFIALVQLSAVGALVWQRWDWLALGSLVVGAPQVAAWMFDRPTALALVAVTTLFWALYVATGIAFDLRDRASALRPASATLVSLAGLAAAAGGFFALREVGHDTAARLWVAALACAHVAVSARAGRGSQAARDLSLLSLAVGVVLGDVALRLLAPPLVASFGWAATAAAFAGLVRRRPARGRELLGGAMGGHLALALGQALLAGGSGRLPGTFPALLAVTVAAFGCARVVTGEPRWRRALDAMGMLTLAYLTATVLEGPALVLAWAAEAVALARVAQAVRDEIAHRGAVAFLALAAAHVLLVEAPPRALIYGAGDLAGAALALGGVGAAALGWRRLLRGPELRASAVLSGATAATLLYLASIAVISAFQPDVMQPWDGGAGLGVRQQGQVALSALWALSGLGILVCGLARGLRPARLGGLALLTIAMAKVFLFDLSTLDALNRVLSFVGLGLLLLVGAYAYGRMGPRGALAPRGEMPR